VGDANLVQLIAYLVYRGGFNGISTEYSQVVVRVDCRELWPVHQRGFGDEL
jgi:hypothetical protein